jgi:hypothetical protein
MRDYLIKHKSTIIIIGVLFMALLAGSTASLAQGDPLLALPDNAVLSYGDPLMLDAIRHSQQVTVARDNDACDCWQIWQAGTWRNVYVEWVHTWLFDADSQQRAYYVVAARVPGGWLVVVSHPRPLGFRYGDWHGQSAVVVEAGW